MLPDQDRPSAAEPPLLDWLDTGTVARVRAALAARACYRDEGGPIERVQTHISSVFLTPRYVFKFKRPVELGFADFHTLARRERFCRAEVALNRRLAEGVYLDVLPLCAVDGGYRLGGGGPVVDWCVVMRHLPPEGMLDRRLQAGGIAPAELEALARLLVDFHRRSAGGPALERYGSAALLRENWEENFRQTEPYLRDLPGQAPHDDLRAAVADWMARHADLLAARVAGGFIRDGHGDLRCEHVSLGADGGDIRIIDCIEFNDRFRYGDVANDLAFLLMDLTALEHPELSRALLERSVYLSGDADLPRLVPFYACYRAYVRGKVTLLKLADRDLAPEQRARARLRAADYFRLARDFARQMAPPVLVAVAGLMGTGKTALAEALAGQTVLRTFNSDALRKALAGTETPRGAEGGGSAHAGFGAGIYTPQWNEQTYAALFQRAEEALDAGRSVILDASFARRAYRERARQLAAARGARFVLVECRLDAAETRRRLRRREREGRSVSEGREALYDRQRAAFEPITELPPEAHRVVDTGRPPAALAADLLRRLELPPPLFSRAH